MIHPDGPEGLMDKYYEDRFKALRDLNERIAPLMEINDILESMRDQLREIIPAALETRILLLDPEAGKYTRPLQCILYDRPVNCQSCKLGRAVIQRALIEGDAAIVHQGEPITRGDGRIVPIGPEAAAPGYVDGQAVVVISVVCKEGGEFRDRDLLLIKDAARTARNIILKAKKHWQMTEEKIRVSKMLTQLSPFVPHTVLDLIEKHPESLSQEKEEKEVSVLFVDLEDYSRLSATRPQTEVNRLVENLFSSFVDPITRSKGDINETAGDGLMIIFKEDDAVTNAVNAVKAAFDIRQRVEEYNRTEVNGAEPLLVNMGINSGLALVGLTRFKGSAGARMTYTASGPVTNLAARLADQAHKGDILIGPETRRLTMGLWPVHDHGPVSLKGWDEPIQAYSLVRGAVG